MRGVRKGHDCVRMPSTVSMSSPNRCLASRSTYNTEITDSVRAPISMAHDNTTLTVSEREATRVEEDAKRRLLASKRLTLVVDLDQTIIHATVDPTVGEWREDKDNPNHEAVRDVRQFQLIDDGPGMRGCWYYIKLRPGLEEFLQNVAEIYELHIYTMGTRAYAQHIVDIIDPTRKLFGDRILSRDESGSLTVKDLQRLFPVDTKMVVIIDDRGDIWRWSPNLIKVSPYDFFVGIGDINSSFLPKKQDIGANKPQIEPKAPEKTKEHHVNGQTQEVTDVSALEQLVTMGGGDSPRLLQEQTDAQEETILHQVEDRPLLQKQKELDAEDNIEGNEPSVEESQESAKHRHHLLVDYDQELYQLQNRLEQVHLQFYEEYDKKRSLALGGRVAALRGEKVHSKDKDVDLKLVPDVKDIMPKIKRRILGGVVLVFSGVLPLGIDFQNADISLWAKSFGVVISSRVNARTTHLVAGRNRTAKVREATRYPGIKIVTTQWLVDSLVQWRHVDEDPYLLPVHPDDRGEPMSPGSLEIETSMLSSTDEDITGSQWTQEDDAEDLFKSSGLDETSPIGYGADEQAAVHDELKDFLGSDDESESDNESLPDETSTGTKRKRGEGADGTTDEEESGDDDGDDSEKGSRLSQRIKRSYERNTKLREITSAPARSDEASSDRPQPMVMEGEDSGSETVGSSQKTGQLGDPDDDEDELEREMLAAFEGGGYDSQLEEDVTAENG
jgi:RNA polymerase II subunit A-like phosphatase